MPEAKTRKPAKKEVSVLKFEIFNNGILNTHIPHNYNWILGSTNPPKSRNFNKRAETLTISHARINGQHIIL